MKIMILNGMYGIQLDEDGNKKKYVDLVAPQYSWQRGDQHFSSCWGSLKAAKETIARIKAFEGEITPYTEESES